MKGLTLENPLVALSSVSQSLQGVNKHRALWRHTTRVSLTLVFSHVKNWSPSLWGAICILACWQNFLWKYRTSFFFNYYYFLNCFHPKIHLRHRTLDTWPEQILSKSEVTAAKVIRGETLNALMLCCFVQTQHTTSLGFLMDILCESPCPAVAQAVFSFVQPMYVCLYHITQFFPQQGRLRGPAKPRMPTTAPHFFVFMKKRQLRGGVEGRTQENVLRLGSYG